MKIKVYSPNGKELLINVKKLSECPLCHELSLIEKSDENDGGVDLFCPNCRLKFISFPFKKFIKLKGFSSAMII